MDERNVLRTGKDEDVRIRYEKVSDQRTTVLIRVGRLGDRQASQVMLDEIWKGL
jgi:hypothetical protein